MTKNRHIAHIILEADTPIKVGSNAMDFLQDSPVQKDWNGLPMILGTSIAGVLRKTFRDEKVFGFQDHENGEGSQVIISNALLVNENGKVCEELLTEKTPFLQIFDSLPVREHTAINSKGVTKKGAKFDEEVVFKGTRFKFSIEFIEENKTTFEEILDILSKPAFRLGGGSTKGFGKFKIIEIKTALVDLETYSSSLNQNLEQTYQPNASVSNYTTYTLTIKPDDFFMFGSGFGDSDADMTPVYEQVISYDNTIGLTSKQILIPASSIKGALAHRTAYHFNKLKGNTIEAGNGVETIVAIFGHKKELDKITQQELGQKGKILISDCFKSLDEDKQTKTFDHVSIDRFTGGAIDGALFQEKTIADDGDSYTIEILLENGIDEQAVNAFQSALKDIATGMLLLGGTTTKGHGVFSGTVFKDGEKL